MVWIVRNGHRYYYHKAWSRQRDRSIYLGSGPLAELFAALDAERAADRRAAFAEHAAQRGLAASIEAASAAVTEFAGALVTASLLITGHHYDNRCRWMRIREGQSMAHIDRATEAYYQFSALRLVDRSLGGGVPDPNPPADAGLTPQELEDFRALVRRVDRNRPAQADLEALQQALIARPGLWRAAADLASSAINVVVNQNIFTTSQKLALRRGADELRAGLAGPDPSPLESTLAEQIAVCWVRLRFCEMVLASASSGKDRTSFKIWEERAAAAQRSYQSACYALARIRRLAVRTPALFQINIGAQQVNLSQDARERLLAALGLSEEAVARAGADLSQLPAWLTHPLDPEAPSAPDPEADRLDVDTLAEVAQLLQALARPKARLKKLKYDAETDP